MGIVLELISLAKVVLGIIEINLRRKYIEQLDKLEDQLWSAWNKGYGERDLALIDNLEREIRQVCRAIANDAKLKGATP